MFSGHQGDLFHEETYVGRAKDKKPAAYEGGKSDPASRVKLEYRWGADYTPHPQPHPYPFP